MTLRPLRKCPAASLASTSHRAQRAGLGGARSRVLIQRLLCLGFSVLLLLALLAGGTGGVLASGSVSFAAVVNYALGTTPWDVKTGDFNADGTLDLAVA